MGTISKGLKDSNLSLTHGADTLPGTFSQLELWTAVTRSFTALFKSGCWQIQFGDVCTIALLCCFYSFFFFSFNDSVLKVD